MRLAFPSVSWAYSWLTFAGAHPAGVTSGGGWA